MLATLDDIRTFRATFVEEDDARAYGVVDEITARIFASGGTVVGLRREDVPGGKELAAILRYSP
ncbi:hypothetical protein [Bosea minatitlanensis]|uniref:Uncharacterized protein n=1 Tax=Bosea minatitlanensis TaxID=128782 RepID=A0ABW0F8B6_9HYPH|nr:hypothetical protein [Bosea minatitlanensis]MCT4493689.1 hypothetical protein [Bosea minatitlanensis]